MEGWKGSMLSFPYNQQTSGSSSSSSSRAGGGLFVAGTVEECDSFCRVLVRSDAEICRQTFCPNFSCTFTFAGAGVRV